MSRLPNPVDARTPVGWGEEVLTTPGRLSAADLAAVAALSERVVAADGGRLKLDAAARADRTDGVVDDLLWWRDGDLVGYLGFDVWGPTVEFAGMVDPAARGQGIGTALVEAAVQTARDRGLTGALLIVPRGSVAGQRIARRREAPLDHSEHALVLRSAPEPAAPDARTTLRPATRQDVPALSEVLTAAFGEPPQHLERVLAAPDDRTLLIEVDGEPAGTVRLTREVVEDLPAGGVYGFAVHPRFQGRGVGRDVLRRVSAQLFAEGVERVGLEVAVDNERALGLYTSVGFAPISTEDYYALPLNP